MKNQKGITLIALVITIIVLLILAGVSIAMLTGKNGILTRASQSSEASLWGEVDEAVKLGVAEIVTNDMDPTYKSGGEDDVGDSVTIDNVAKAITQNNANLTATVDGGSIDSPIEGGNIEVTVAAGTSGNPVKVTWKSYSWEIDANGKVTQPDRPANSKE